MMSDTLLPLLLAGVLGYALGSIPFGLLLTRAAGLGDIRAIGSGNIGATNVLRTGKRGLAAGTLAFDMLKGAAAVWIATALVGPSAALAAGAGAFLGHVFPVWLRFKGGKGVATYIGVLLGLAWPAALAFCTLWLLVAFASRRSSLSALVATVACPILLLMLAQPGAAALMAALGLVLIAKHEANIRRLLAGTEPTIELGRKR